MSELAKRSCVPCRGGVPPLSTDAQTLLLEQLNADWEVVDGHHLSRVLHFPDFVAALAYVNAIGAIAEEEGHHPDLLLSWGKVQVQVWTHKINGLTESDFILAAKADVLYLDR
jgi:4a-hydroxytetrahydrobiopterin dehydratase